MEKMLREVILFGLTLEIDLVQVDLTTRVQAEGIMSGLRYFSDIIDFMFTTKPAKPMRKQKRNDNESSDSRE